MKTLIILSLFLLSCAGSNQSSKSYGEDLLAYAPSQSDVIFYMNVSDIRNSEMAQNEIKEHSDKFFKEGKKHLEEFIKITGLDPEKDINAFLVAADTKEGKDDKNGVMVAQGNFDESKLVEFAKAELLKIDDTEIALSQETVARKTVYKIHAKYMKEDKTDEKEIGITFINNSIVVMSDFDNIESVLNSKENLLSNSEMMSKIKSVNNHQMYAVMDAEQIREKIQGNARAEKIASFMKDLAFSMNFDSEMTMSMISNCVEANQAEMMKELIEGLVAGAKLAVSEERELIDLMQEVEIDQNNNQVKVSITVDQKRLDKLKKYEKKFKSDI